MPTKTEFKFNCPTCGQHILAATEWCGRKINCPSCQTSITIPELPKEKKKPAPVMPPSPTTHPNYSSRPIRVELPAQDKDEWKVANAKRSRLTENATHHRRSRDEGPADFTHCHRTAATPHRGAHTRREARHGSGRAPSPYE